MDSRYTIYHDSFTLAIQETEKLIKKLGLTFDNISIPDNDGNQLATKVGFGPSKPSSGATNQYHFELFKANKLFKKQLHVQIYNRETLRKTFELNMYIS